MIYARNLKNTQAVHGVDPGECALFADPALDADALEAEGFEVLRMRPHDGARVVGAAPPRRGPGRPRKDAPAPAPSPGGAKEPEPAPAEDSGGE